MSTYNDKTFADLEKANPKAKGDVAKPTAMFLFCLWLIFVVNRAVHPLAIDYSKEVTSKVEPIAAGDYSIGSRIALDGIGDRYEGRRFLADIVDVDAESVKVRYTEGGYKRFPIKDFEAILTKMPAAKSGKYEVGARVRLQGTGKRYEGGHYPADVVDIERNSVKVRYTSGGWKRFPRKEFEKLMTPMPDLAKGEYEVGMHVRLQGTGRWHAGSAYYVDIVEVAEDNVKVLYADGAYKRMDREVFEELLRDSPKPEKGEVVRELNYKKLTPVLMKSFLCLFVCTLMGLLDKDGWKAGLAKCYTGPSVRLFAFIGCVYAIGDYLEMTSMGGMDGAAYQVLLQSKLVITAFMMWAIKGRPAKQTRTQWAALATVTLGMVVFMSSQSKGKSGGNSAGILAIMMVVGKVVVSCYAAVMSDQSLKKYKDLPLHAQLCQLFLPWGVASFVLAMIFEPSSMSSPAAFFHGWNAGTVLVMFSFSIKTVITMTLLKTLDSISKNIGEAVAVLVIYVMQIVLPTFSKEFEMDTFIAMTIVVMTVTTYMFLKQDLDVTKAAAAKKN